MIYNNETSYGKYPAKIYAYSMPNDARFDGYLKICMVHFDNDDQYKLEKTIVAAYYDSSNDTFTDADVRNFLYKLGFEGFENTDCVKITVSDFGNQIEDFRKTRGVLRRGGIVPVPYRLRKEQDDAVSMTIKYFNSHPNSEFLWNAKPRFGKTLCVYDLIQRMHFRNVLIVTNRPAIADSWYNDYEKYLAKQSGYRFVSSVDVIKDGKLVISCADYERERKKGLSYGRIEFVSLQDLKGSVSFGGEYRKLGYIAEINWDLLVVDEAHEGVDTIRTSSAFRAVHRKFTLHLSGTPFKALKNDKFDSDAIYNWTYADEQEAKREWGEVEGNPYTVLPKMNMFTYKMSDIVQDELKHGVNVQGSQHAYSFDLSEFFSVNDNGDFIHDAAVDRFLDALTTQERFPFSTPELRNELRHTLWLLNHVNSAKALAKKLNAHEVFSEYDVIIAAGDGKLDSSEDSEKALIRVRNTIRGSKNKTITISVGQLTTGVTVPEWTGVLMLSTIKSPALYMQAAFRAQNPWVFRSGPSCYYKMNSYVFDFDPARTLVIYDKFANDLTPSSDGVRARGVEVLLNFFPVIGEDKNSEMVPLDAEAIMSIPRKLKSDEVVRSSFTSDFLFSSSISDTSNTPKEVLDIIERLGATTRKGTSKKSTNLPDKKNLNKDAETEEITIGMHTDLFGEKYTQKAVTDIFELVSSVSEDVSKKGKTIAIDKLSEYANDHYVSPIIDLTTGGLGKRDKSNIARKLNHEVKGIIKKCEDDYASERSVLNGKFKEGFLTAEEHRDEVSKLKDKLCNTLVSMLDDNKEHLRDMAVNEVRAVKHNASIQENADALRDHLRGFSRTIPSFLMAYGDDNSITLSNFDSVIPEDVFLDVTSITLDQFRMLRDGGKFTTDDGTVVEYPGVFDEAVFNDSVETFMEKKRELANYFDESHSEDIFDYIPPQKTNQVFTPRWVVQKMLDELEEENPGCFDDPDNTFADLYMKSGLYIAEIVKRLYNSDNMKDRFKNDTERIYHILQNQVYGLAPNEIIYKISTNYILGFDSKLKNATKNFKIGDASKAAQNHELQRLVNECFGR